VKIQEFYYLSYISEYTYDLLGRKIQSNVPDAVTGSWNVSTASLAAGIYFVRMEADVTVLQAQELVITH
jgi:hypothetical protein